LLIILLGTALFFYLAQSFWKVIVTEPLEGGGISLFQGNDPEFSKGVKEESPEFGTSQNRKLTR
jgi:hypothetical protein